LHAEIEIHQVDVEIGKDQFVFDFLPDDPSHLVAVHLDDGISNLDFRHFKKPLFEGPAFETVVGLTENPARAHRDAAAAALARSIALPLVP
jgi:hypothetical protein